jgi:ribosomal protein L29
MSKKKSQNFKIMKDVELEKELVSMRENIRVVKFKAEGSKSKNVKEISALKKNIARVLTELRNRTKK